MNIEDTTKNATKVDMTLAPIPKLDLSSIRANVDAIQAEALRLNDIIKGMPKQESSPTPKPIGSTGNIQVPQLQQKTEEQRVADFQAQRQASFQAMGITEEDYNKRQNLATQMSSLNAQLQQLDVAEQQAMIDIENLMPGALLSAVRGEQAQVQRTLAFKKAGIAAQMSALSGEYSAIQGRIDEAQNFFNQYIQYATTEKREEMDMYKWALNFYYDADQDTKKWLQQEYENKRGEYDRQYREEQDKINNWFKEQGLALDIARESRLSQEVGVETASLFDNFLLNALAENDPQTAAQLAKAYSNDLGIKISLGALTERANQLKTEPVLKTTTQPKPITAKEIGAQFTPDLITGSMEKQAQFIQKWTGLKTATDFFSGLFGL